MVLEGYDVYSKFDLEKHKVKYINYLEVMIDADGNIDYAVPSHQEYAIRVACERHGISRDELDRRCPPEYYFDYMTWLLRQSDIMAVWNDWYMCEKPTRAQYAALRRLKMNGVYRGALPKVVE